MVPLRLTEIGIFMFMLDFHIQTGLAGTTDQRISFPLPRLYAFLDGLVNGFRAYGLALQIRRQLRRQPPGDRFRAPMYRKTFFNVPLNFFIFQPVRMMLLVLCLNRSFMSLVAVVGSFSNRRSVAVEFPRYRKPGIRIFFLISLKYLFK